MSVKKIWRNIKPYFLNESNFSNKIMISEKDYLVSDEKRPSGIFEKHFINIAKTLDLKPSTYLPLQVFPKLLKLLNITTALRYFFLQRY